jgi:UDP-N-acetylmuramoyl-tripeptide--D-alanyl-D-alanine ligase
MQIHEIYQLFLGNPLICTDTRKLLPNSLFFALKGGNFNGNLFADQALESGAAFAIVDEPQGKDDSRKILVDDALTCLQQLATYHRQQLNIPVLGITGSNGKTTSKELIAAVLKKKFNTYFTQGNLNNHIGVPLTLLALNKSHEFAVVEMGANHQKEIELLAAIAEPNFGLITNIGKAHLEGFGGIEGVKKGKGELYDFLKSKNHLVFIQHDNPTLVEILKNYHNVFTYGTTSTNQVQGFAKMNNEFLEVDILKPNNFSIQTQLTGDYNLDNVLSAVAIGTYFNINTELIKEAIENYVPDNQRSQIIKKGELTIVLDAYNANPTSMLAALNNFECAFAGKKTLALGEMRELGEESSSEHLKIAERASKINTLKVITVGPLFEEAAMKFNFIHFNTSHEAAAYLKSNLINGTLLIKGSRGSKMEVIMEAFT